MHVRSTYLTTDVYCESLKPTYRWEGIGDSPDGKLCRVDRVLFNTVPDNVGREDGCWRGEKAEINADPRTKYETKPCAVKR